MSKNIGRLDQMIRIGISLALIYVGFIDNQLIDDSFSANMIGGVGILSAIVALIRFCPLYALTGINTCHQHIK